MKKTISLLLCLWPTIRSITPPLVLIIISTLTYYIPSQIVDISNIKTRELDHDFYLFYCLYTSGMFLLVATYAVYLFVNVPSTNYKAKVLYLWLVIAETFTFVKHAANKVLDLDLYRPSAIVETLVIFGICCLWLTSRAIHVDKSAKFHSDRTYILKFKPKNIIGIFNHIANLHGHVGIYQDGEIYKFKKARRMVVSIPGTQEYIKSMIQLGQLSVREIPANYNMPNMVGKKYNLFRYNCNHLIKDALGRG